MDAGFTPLQALQTATINPARFLGSTRDFGTVELGKIADLVLVDADPTKEIANTQKIAGVVLNGRYFSRDALYEVVQQGLQKLDGGAR